MEVRNLTFSYNKRNLSDSVIPVLEDISFQVMPGKITTLLGANGCGKTTLFNLMTKNLKPLNGEILLNGRNISEMKQKEFAKKVAIVHQNNQLGGDITVEKLVSYGRTPHLSMFGMPGGEDEQVIDWAMEITRVQKYREREVRSLSGGQRQRVWIAMALAQKTDLLLLDEPTTYLDIRYQIELLEMIRNLNKQFGLTIIMVLHDINHAVYYSDLVIGLKDGKVLAEGTPAEVITPECIEAVYGIRLEVEQWKNRKYVMTIR
jgi:iron complex transport system ATP-binding protein